MKSTFKKNIVSIQSIKPAFYYLLAALFLLFEMGVQSSPGVMANNIMKELQVGAGGFGLAMGCYFFSYTLMEIPAGLLYDRFPAKPLLMMAVLVCSIGAYVFSLGHGLWLLALARFLTGLGSSFAFIGVLVVANQWFPARYFALLVGIAQWVAAMGAMAGEMPLAYWVKAYGWQHASVLLSLIGLVLLALIFMLMRSKPVSSHSSVVRPYQSLFNILRNKQTYFIAIYAFTSWSPIVLFAELWGVPYLIVRQHISNVASAEYGVFIWIGLALMSPLLGFISDKVQQRRLFLVLCSAIGLTAAVLLLYSPVRGHVSLVVIMLMIGVASAGQILCFALVRDHFPKQDLAVAIGVINMAVVVGGALFQPVVGFLLQWHAHSSAVKASLSYTLHDYVFALAVVPIVYVIGLVVSLFFVRDVKNVSC